MSLLASASAFSCCLFHSLIFSTAASFFSLSSPAVFLAMCLSFSVRSSRSFFSSASSCSLSLFSSSIISSLSSSDFLDFSNLFRSAALRARSLSFSLWRMSSASFCRSLAALSRSRRDFRMRSTNASPFFFLSFSSFALRSFSTSAAFSASAFSRIFLTCSSNSSCSLLRSSGSVAASRFLHAISTFFSNFFSTPSLSFFSSSASFERASLTSLTVSLIFSSIFLLKLFICSRMRSASFLSLSSCSWSSLICSFRRSFSVSFSIFALSSSAVPLSAPASSSFLCLAFCALARASAIFLRMRALRMSIWFFFSLANSSRFLARSLSAWLMRPLTVFSSFILAAASSSSFCFSAFFSLSAPSSISFNFLSYSSLILAASSPFSTVTLLSPSWILFKTCSFRSFPARFFSCSLAFLSASAALSRASRRRRSRSALRFFRSSVSLWRRFSASPSVTCKAICTSASLTRSMSSASLSNSFLKSSSSFSSSS
mmetsp:Transcript_7503/g.14613  ORF Transcript_7503/g.14613 Transcript_7503/m.14613 type:complete len:486 (-) Transcript_7503:776-2233(-)